MVATVTEENPYFLLNRAYRHSLKFVSMRSEPRNILKIFLNFTDFEPHYSYKIYSYKKKECKLKDRDKGNVKLHVMGLS